MYIIYYIIRNHQSDVYIPSIFFPNKDTTSRSGRVCIYITYVICISVDVFCPELRHLTQQDTRPGGRRKLETVEYILEIVTGSVYIVYACIYTGGKTETSRRISRKSPVPKAFH